MVLTLILSFFDSTLLTVALIREFVHETTAREPPFTRRLPFSPSGPKSFPEMVIKSSVFTFCPTTLSIWGTAFL